MAEKSSTVVIEVYDCSSCSKKIWKALCVLQEKFTIASIAFDEKKNTFTVSGPFNPDCFIKKICCLAHKVIKNIYEKPKEPPKPQPTPTPTPKPTPPLDVNLKILEWPCLEPCPKPCPRPCLERCPSRPCSCGHGDNQCSSRPCSCGHCVELCPIRPFSFNPECIKIVCENDPSDGCSIM